MPIFSAIMVFTRTEQKLYYSQVNNVTYEVQQTLHIWL